MQNRISLPAFGFKRTFDIMANGTLLATEVFNRSKPGQFSEERYTIPADVLAAATDGRVTIKMD